MSPVVSLLSVSQASAAQITNRSLTLVANGSNGGSAPGVASNHSFTFTVPSSISSIEFEYCTTASVAACVLPTGIVTTGATLGTTTGWASGSTLNTTANGAPYITKGSASGGAATMTVQLNGVVNPTTTNYTFFVRINAYTGAALGGTLADTGTVAASTAEPIVLTGTMPESLIFCTGATVTVNCGSTTPGTVSFDQLFSPVDTATASSQMAASTNAGSGYAITVNGATLTSGSNTIAPMSTAALGVRGTGQFGMNLKLNTTLTSTVAVGAEIDPVSDGVDLKGQPATGYQTVDTFKFTSADVVANSASGGAGPTNSQVYTVSYIVNVAGNQPSGTYTTTLTYICTATF